MGGFSNKYDESTLKVSTDNTAMTTTISTAKYARNAKVEEVDFLDDMIEKISSNSIYHEPQKFDTNSDDNITHTFTSKDAIEVTNGDYDDIHKDLGKVSFDNCNEINIAVERTNPWDRNASCDCLSGACETKDYRIISYRSDDSSKQRIKIYDKKTNELVSEFTTTELDHTNGLTTDGKYIYVANCGESDEDHKKISRFSLEDALKGKPKISTENFKVRVGGKEEEEFISGLSHDYKNNDTCATAVGSDIYISKGDGSVYHSRKIKITDDDMAKTTQDICVANNKVYVIRTKFPEFTNRNVDADDGWNVIDIYDTNGKYIGTKTIDLPGSYDKDFWGNSKDTKYYRELESISYDEKTDSFSLYFQSPNWGDLALTRNALSPPHVVVTGVKM